MPKIGIYSRRGFFKIDDGIFKGKGISALLDSREKKDAAISLFGGRENIPTSIMRAKRSRPSKDIDNPVAEGRRYSDTGWGKKAKEMGLPHRAFEMSERGVKGRRYDAGVAAINKMSGQDVKGGALSTFPQNVGKSILLLYSDPGQIVLDPFAGHNSRLDLCVNNGRHYIGYDICKEFMDFNKSRAKILRKNLPSAKIKLYDQDSREMRYTKSSSADFTITSPPYYDVEYYGPENEQLGKLKTYGKFLAGIKSVLSENLRVLKSGSFSVWFVNDFRRKKKFHIYHADVLRLAEEVGFKIVDLFIVDFGPCIRDVFINETIKTRIIPKRHEYGLVFRKP